MVDKLPVLEQRYRNEVVKIVYDIDDTLTNLTDVALGILGFPMEKFNHFSIQDNPHMTDDQKNRLFQLFHEASTFRRTQLVPGATDITKFNGVNSEVHLNSNNFSREVLATKVYQILTGIEFMPTERIHMHMNPNHCKPLPEGTRIVVDDHYHLLMGYPEDIVRIVIDKNWNHADIYETTDEETGILRASSLIDANNMIYRILLQSGIQTDYQIRE